MWPALAAIAAGVYTAYIDFHATEVTPTLLAIVITAFTLGVACGRLAWLWALLLAATLTSAHLLAPLFGILPRDGGNIGNPLSLMIVALPAAVCSYLGAGLRSLTTTNRV